MSEAQHMGPQTLSIFSTWSKFDVLNLAGFCNGSSSQVSHPSPATGATVRIETSSREVEGISIERGLCQQKHNLDSIIASTNFADCLAVDCHRKLQL